MYIRETELAHHGIKGMHWGVRRYQNSDGTYTAAGKKRHQQKLETRKKLDKLIKEEYKQSEYARLEKEFKRKHPNADQDDFDDYLMDSRYDEDKDSHLRKAHELESDKLRLSDDYVRMQVEGSALVSAFTLAPVVMTATSWATKDSDYSVPAILASGVGTVAVSSLMAYNSAKKRETQVMQKYRIE